MSTFILSELSSHHWLWPCCVLARAEACNTGQALLQKKYMVSVRGNEQKDGSFGEGKDGMETLYRLLEDDPHSALNAGQTASCNPMEGRSGLDRALSTSVTSSLLFTACPCSWLLAFGLAWVCVLRQRSLWWLEFNASSVFNSQTQGPFGTLLQTCHHDNWSDECSIFKSLFPTVSVLIPLICFCNYPINLFTYYKTYAEKYGHICNLSLI